jgi:hypothetical protein
MVSWELATSELWRHRNHGTQTCEREGKTSVLLGQVGLIAASPDERADLEHMLGFPTRSVKFNVWLPLARVESAKRVLFSEFRNTYDLMTLCRNPSTLRLLTAERPIGLMGFAPTGDRRLSWHTHLLGIPRGDRVDDILQMGI